MARIGIDMVDVRRVRRLLERSDSFEKHTFTEAEQRAAGQAPDKAEYLAARFAVKEAAFKALAHYTEKKTFDFRMVETLNESDGCPLITRSEPLEKLMAEAGVEKISVSISTETDYAVAIVLAE